MSTATHTEPTYIVYFSKDSRPNVYDQINPDTGAGHYGLSLIHI